MDRFFKRKSLSVVEDVDREKSNSVTFDITQLPTDPGLRIPILDYDVNIRDQVRIAYMQKGPCQPLDHDFPYRPFGQTQTRRFNPAWFKEFGSWLEYSVLKDAAFCLYCYLFKTSVGKQGGGDTFVSEGFSYWKSKDKLNIHVGDHDSAHNKARIKCETLMNQEQHIQSAFFKQSKQVRSDYRIRLTASIDCIRLLLRQGLSFRGHDESENSKNLGNFLVLLQFLGDHNDEIKAVTMNKAPLNCKLTSPDVQKDIVSACAAETINAIIKDIGDLFFSILVDESRDVSTKKQMSIVLRYVNNSGQVNERFIGFEHVSSTTALSLKAAINKTFSKYNLSLSRLRGQGYDGTSNMQGEFNGLKSLILKENPCAFYIHCFVHQLQLALVAVAKKNTPISNFFRLVTDVVNIVGASSKCCDHLREKQTNIVAKALENGEILSGMGLNQETTLQRSGDMRWGSHYNSLISLLAMFSAVIDVLEMISVDGSNSDKKGEAYNLLESILSFDFAFNLHLMIIVLVHYIDVPNMDDIFIRRAARGRPQRQAPKITYLHHFRVDLFYAVIDMQLQELNDRFSEANTELLLCVACLCPKDSFSAFDNKILIQLAEFYPEDFSSINLLTLDDQLETFIFNMRSNKEFEGLKGLGDLAEKLVMTKKNIIYPLVYKLLTLVLVLPIATATVERVFSAMNIVKDRLRNRMGDQWMNDSLVVYVEKEIFSNIDNEVIIQRYQNMKNRKELL
ncbi:uncharacterized protein LOC127794728 [Diospyros lotus]|uniref:uncharacterized protein LOC127794728 n=1 Tax=Diospyros lotus TaxID=55363 RepID=UPI0022541180|nr:uncharacterized protein LOC127794728 [Diospyros lotus]